MFFVFSFLFLFVVFKKFMNVQIKNSKNRTKQQKLKYISKNKKPKKKVKTSKKKKNNSQNQNKMSNTTPYGVSTSIGTQATNGYVNAAVIGPLNSHQYPGAIPYHSYGSLPGIRPTPPQFLPSQDPLYAEMVSNPRQMYRRSFSFATNQTNNVRKGADKYIEQGVLVGGAPNNVFTPSAPTSSFIRNSGRHAIVSTHANYIAPVPSSMYLNQRKSIAVGKSAYKVGLPDAALLSTKNYYPSGVRSSVRRARSGGCTAPKKKGSIYNVNLSNGAVCAWGALPRQDY